MKLFNGFGIYSYYKGNGFFINFDLSSIMIGFMFIGDEELIVESGLIVV